MATENERANKRYTCSPKNRKPNNDKLYSVNVNTPISFAEKLYFIIKENKYDDEKLQLTVVKTGTMTNKETYSTCR